MNCHAVLQSECSLSIDVSGKLDQFWASEHDGGAQALVSSASSPVIFRTEQANRIWCTRVEGNRL